MSIRNDITNNIVALLGDQTDPKPIFVTREQLDLENIARQQFPAVVVRTGDENRTEHTMQGANGNRDAILNVVCQCYVTGANIDLQLNDIAERIEAVLEVDRSRGGVAYDTRLSTLEVDQTIDKRFGLITLNFEVEYIYKRGEA
tara:strand:- start:1327 stop:1758 length:432 start_codon:yes stop_codon:yes gene_type:complete